MSDFQKQTLLKYARNFLILCGIALLVYGMVKSELIRWSVLTLFVLTIVVGFAWSVIRVTRWDWWLRGKLTEDEYDAYLACDRFFGWRDDKYIPTKEQINLITMEAKEDADTLWNMYNKLTGKGE